MLFLILGLSFITLFIIFKIVFAKYYISQNLVEIRLSNVSKMGDKDGDDELNQPLFVRLVKPFLNDISKAIISITPKELIANFEKKVTMAGNPFNLGVKEWLNMQVMSILCIPLFTIVIGYANEAEFKSIFLYCLVESIVIAVLPSFILGGKVKQRQKEITQDLPDVLDLLTVSVEAGLGFDGALAKVIDKMPGAIAYEFDNVLQEMKVGKHKREAFKDMAERVNVPDLTSFIGAIIQADQLGVSIGNVLRLQSQQMREKRRQRAKEKAMKAPVKMLIPMVLFIFPTIFSVLIGPVAVKVIRTLLK